jgi:hypothetical protein
MTLDIFPLARGVCFQEQRFYMVSVTSWSRISIARLAASFNLGNLPRWTLALSTKYLFTTGGLLEGLIDYSTTEDSPVDYPAISSLAGALISIPVLILLTLRLVSRPLEFLCLLAPTRIPSGAV